MSELTRTVESILEPLVIAIPITALLLHLAALSFLISTEITGIHQEEQSSKKEPMPQTEPQSEPNPALGDQNPDENDTVRESLPKEHQLFTDGLIK